MAQDLPDNLKVTVDKFMVSKICIDRESLTVLADFKTGSYTDQYNFLGNLIFNPALPPVGMQWSALMQLNDPKVVAKLAASLNENGNKLIMAIQNYQANPANETIAAVMNAIDDFLKDAAENYFKDEILK